MSIKLLFCTRQPARLGDRMLGIMALVAVLTAGPAGAHSGDLALQPGTTLAATFDVASLPTGLAPSTPFRALAHNIEVNYPPQTILFGYVPQVRGLVLSMTDIAFTDAAVGSFELTGWELNLVTMASFPQGAPLGADGRFSLADHELRIDQGLLTGNLVGYGPIERNFATDPLTLTQRSDLTGRAFGDTSDDYEADVSLSMPFDHAGSLAALGGPSLDVLIQGRLVADGRIEVIPEPSTWMLLAFGVAALGGWQRRRR